MTAVGKAWVHRNVDRPLPNVQSCSHAEPWNCAVTYRLVGFLGLGAWVLFWSTSVLLGSVRPSYSHVVNMISELGAVGTPYATAWNVFGFIIPGAILGFVGVVIARAVITHPSTVRTVATVLFVAFGLGVIGQGVMPAKMLNGVADITSTSTRGHFICSLITGAAWAVGALTLVIPMKRNPRWRGLHIASSVLVALTLVASLALRGAVPDGLAERLGDAFFCAWFILMSLNLIRLGQAVNGR
jgi:hypothetical membrane protein